MTQGVIHVGKSWRVGQLKKGLSRMLAVAEPVSVGGRLGNKNVDGWEERWEPMDHLKPTGWPRICRWPCPSLPRSLTNAGEIGKPCEWVSRQRWWKSTHWHNCPHRLGRDTFEDVEKFAYLGSVLDMKGGTGQDIKSRIGKAREEVRLLRKIWTSKS
jgi:hypothetical protein